MSNDKIKIKLFNLNFSKLLNKTKSEPNFYAKANRPWSTS